MFQLLSNPVLGLNGSVLPFATPLYISELSYIVRSLGTDLKKGSIVKTCKFLYDIAVTNGAVKNGDVPAFWVAASNPNSKLVS